jgi:DNA-binding NarL/FixJ family response regulator
VNNEIIGACDADEATLHLEANDDFDLVLLDLMLPGTSGMAFLGVIRKRFPHVPVVVLSAIDDSSTVMKAIRQGAAGYVTKSSATDVLLGALREVLAGAIWLPPEYREMATKPRRNRTVSERYGLTRSQARVLELLSEGKTNRDIAEMLDVTEGTVKIHVSAIFKAMGVNNRSQALLLAQGKK